MRVRSIIAGAALLLAPAVVAGCHTSAAGTLCREHINSNEFVAIAQVTAQRPDGAYCVVHRFNDPNSCRDFFIRFNDHIIEWHGSCQGT